MNESLATCITTIDELNAETNFMARYRIDNLEKRELIRIIEIFSLIDECQFALSDEISDILHSEIDKLAEKSDQRRDNTEKCIFNILSGKRFDDVTDLELSETLGIRQLNANRLRNNKSNTVSSSKQEEILNILSDKFV